MSGFNLAFPEGDILDLVERGLVERVYDPIKGETVYELTEAGKAHYEAAIGQALP